MAKKGNTSNLKTHLKNNHKAVHSQLKQTKESSQPTTSKSLSRTQPTISESFTNSQPYSHQSKRWKDLNDAVAHHICKDGLPIYTVEKEGFRSMVKALDSRYELPSRVHFSQSVIPDLYASTRAKVAEQLAGVDFFAATADLWSSIGLKPYLGYTLHYVDKEWNLRSLSLSTSFLPEDHTGDVLAEAFTETLEEWNLCPTKQVCMTTDSGANIVAAARILKWTQISCFGHNLHLAITKALDKDRRCARALGVARKIVSAFSYS